jgi:hypothetical protein
MDWDAVTRLLEPQRQPTSPQLHPALTQDVSQIELE